MKLLNQLPGRKNHFDTAESAGELKRIFLILFGLQIFFSYSVLAAEGNVSFSQSAQEIDVYDFVEMTVQTRGLDINNPFVDANISGQFKCVTESQSISVEGFCDSQDGSICRIRYMPTGAGDYTYTIVLDAKNKTYKHTGSFKAVDGKRKGVLRVDKEYPWHFVWEGTGEHYFWNGTTTYWILGWKDEAIIRNAIDRLASLKVNRIRVAINGRQDDGSRWSEPLVKESEKFTFKLNPWVAQRPDDLENPDFDVTRFNVSHWQKIDRLVAQCRDKDMIVSLIFYVDGREHGCDPFKKEKMGNEDEQRYYRYAAARYSAYSNVMWDVTNEYHLFRSEEWVNKMGTLLKSVDPAKHLISVHGHSEFPFRKSPWVDVVLYQSWDECGGYDFITNCRKKQAAAGRILPQVNEEYGYEDHYPPWGCGATASKKEDGRSADNRRRLAWEIYMAGGYQTTGERANEGTGAGKDTGGGWINGRGNDSMVMLIGYAIIRDIFEQVEYWKMNPHVELVSYGNLCLAEPGKQYLVYSRLQHCRVVLPKGIYTVKMINPRTGQESNLPNTNAEEGAWQYPKQLSDDWVFIIKKKERNN
jgi:hypothetical protein